MFAYFIRRVLQFVPTILGVTLIVFVLLNVLPGNAALTDLAGPPDQSRGPARLDRLLHRPDGDLPGVVCLRRCWRTTDGALAT